MSYAFRQEDRSVEGSVRRIAGKQITKAIAEIDDAALPDDETAHQVRKRCKKLRALIRLVRPSFPAYAEENARFRDIARELSEFRDAAAVMETFDGLTAFYADQMDSGAGGQSQTLIPLG